MIQPSMIYGSYTWVVTKFITELAKDNSEKHRKSNDWCK